MSQAQRETKSLLRGFELKGTNDDARSFTGLAAAFSLDQGGDVILPGAFKRTLADFKRAKSKIIPLLDSHSRGSVRDIVGKMTIGEEVKDGPETTFEVIDGPDGDEVYRRVKGGYLDGLSIGYEPVEIRAPNADEAKTGIWRFLKEVKLLEVSVVAFPMNVDARIDLASVKQMLAKGDALTPEDRDELLQMQDDLRALLEKTAPAPAAPIIPELAPDAPEREALSARVLALKLRCLGVAIA